jgi:uncharacterized tellurite resistance protein B-like protein
VLDELDTTQRLNLLRFVCSFAWADLEIRPAERAFVSRLVDRLGLEGSEEAQVSAWLESPPPEEELDPHLIPAEHRELFIETVRGVIRVDGEIAPEEVENLELLSELLGWKLPDEGVAPA